MLLLNPYGVDMSTSGLIVQAQSRRRFLQTGLSHLPYAPIA
jgi:hypothetical protein